MAHKHWHITYRVPAGYRVLDTVPWTSKEAADAAIARLSWAKYEKPIARAFAAPWCMGICPKAS